MKKLVVTLLLAAMTLSVVACGGKKDEEPSTTPSSTVESSVEESTDEITDESSEEDVVVDENTDEITDGEEGQVEYPVSSGVAKELRDAVVAAFGENYPAPMEMPADYLEGMYGISPDMYESYAGDMPMIMTNVDTLLVIQPKADRFEEVKTILETYLANKTADDSLRFEYPFNIGKVSAARVDVIGDCVVYTQLGGDIFGIYETEGDAAVIEACQETNQTAVDAMLAVVEQ